VLAIVKKKKKRRHGKLRKSSVFITYLRISRLVQNLLVGLRTTW